jgi:nicotinamide mononucleotide transporter
MGALDWIATILGVACVALAALRSVWTFPAAIVSVTLLGVVVFREQLYSDALLQAFFVAANVYGWLNWTRVRQATGVVVVERMTCAARWRWGAGILAATLVWGAAMATLTDASFPWWDAGIAMASVAAQVLMGRRKLENWLLWIAVDVASVPLYLAKGLNLFAGLYVIYLTLAIWGFVDWRRAARVEAVAA